MADLYLDEDVKRAAAALLRARSHVVRHARDYRKGAGDDEQLLIAARQRWTLVTSNQDDFRLLHSAWLRWSHAWRVAPEHSGILLVRNEMSSEQIAAIVHAFFSANQPLTNRLYRWTQPLGWEEEPTTPPPEGVAG